jgi:queuine/archaeosine tRNA-ribosyltransferase
MKFLFADGLDVVDPNYDFINDRNAEKRKPYWDDQYPHEILGYAPYDGILVSRGVVGDHLFKGHYTASQSMRFRRDGARKFLRFDGPEHATTMMMGDSGAFSYVDMERPPYTATDMVEFYGDAQFTHGVSIDHIIFDFDSRNPPESEVSEGVRERYQITQENAEAFLKESKQLTNFTPMGAVQGWSPASLAEAARNLEKMGYTYIAIGGLVPLKASQIHEVLVAVREKVSSKLNIHLLGFAKAEQIHEFVKYDITSFDSTSPLIRAFKDAKSNYYVKRADGSLDYYSAIRIPQATENPRLMQAVKRGDVKQEALVHMERKALDSVRAYDLGKASIDEALDAVTIYSRPMLWDPKKTQEKNEAEVSNNRDRVRRTLQDQPWKECSCEVCRKASIEVAIFRASNRNKRRGIHNLSVYYSHLKATLG